MTRIVKRFEIDEERESHPGHPEDVYVREVIDYYDQWACGCGYTCEAKRGDTPPKCPWCTKHHRQRFVERTCACGKSLYGPDHVLTVECRIR